MTIQKFILENGMEVVLEENHAAKVVSFNALVKVGSADETDAEAGICHVIEHMLFKGTPKRPQGTIARDVEAAGGEINAYTSIDQTVFYINMATEFSDRGLEILSDAVQNPLFDADELEREKEVILEEIRREHDNPSRMVNEYLFQTAFQKHTYGRPIIGFPETVKSFTHEILKSFYQKWYSPKNISFIAVGDFETKAMFTKIQTQFSNFHGPSLAPPQTCVEPAQSQTRITVKAMNIQSAYLTIGFHVPNITHEDIPALDVLSHTLGGTDSSRLEQEIKEKKQLVHNIHTYSFTPKHPGLFVVGAMLSDEKLIQSIKGIYSEIEKIAEEGISSHELTRAKLNIKSNEIYEKETVGGQAGKIAYFMSTAGDHEFEKRYYQMLSDVDAKVVKCAAKKYLISNKCTISLLVPEKSKWVQSQKEIETAVLLPTSTAKTKKANEGMVPRKIRLKNGAKLIVLENHNLPIASICVATLGGTRSENKKNNGISGLMARLLTKGTKSRSAVEIAKEIEKMAGHIDGFSGRNACGVKCDILSEHIQGAFDLVSDIVCNPKFSNDEVTKERSLVLQAIKDQEDQLSSLAFAEFLKTLFPTHPYGLRSIGTIESIKKIKREDIVRYHKSLFRTSNMTISVVGDVCSKEVEKLANEIFNNLSKGKPSTLKIKKDAPPKKHFESTIEKHGKEQAHIVIGFQGTTFKNKDRYTMTVLNNILSGQGGRLFLNLRDRLSLAYSVSSVNHEGIEPGYFAVYIGTEPGKIKIASEEIIKELNHICSGLVSQEEFERSKQYLVGTYELDLQRNSTLAALYTFNDLYGIELSEVRDYPQHILSVTREDILAVARRYINLEAYTMAIVRPNSNH